MPVRVFVLGFGKVGRWLVRLLLEEYRDRFHLLGVTSSKGTVLAEGPADRAVLARLAKGARSLSEHPSFIPGLLAPDSVLATRPNMVLVAIPPSYQTGEPNTSMYKSFIEAGIGIVTADKTVLALHFEEIVSLAAESGVPLGFRATVAAGTPVLDVASALRWRGVSRVRAVLNATTNYVLGLLERGLTLDDAVRRSIEAGLAEPDPSIDLEGWDAAAKLTILANVLGIPARLDEVERRPLSEALGRARGGGRLKQVAYLDAEKGILRVSPEIVSPGDPLARAEGEGNVVVFGLEDDEIVVEGPAGPAWRTARVMIADALDLAGKTVSMVPRVSL